VFPASWQYIILTFSYTWLFVCLCISVHLSPSVSLYIYIYIYIYISQAADAVDDLLESLSNSPAGGAPCELREKANRLLLDCHRLPIHRSQSTMAIDVVERTMRRVGEKLLNHDHVFRDDQSRNDQARSVISL